jgi:UDP-N-acetylglucosamine diphosphorylase/glucosamine-1-phosphate N-acetyltransferase
VTPGVVVLFEDDGHRDLWPLAATRPVWDLRLGGHTLGEKVRAHFHDAEFAAVGRDDVLAAAAEEGVPWPALETLSIRGDVLWINGRALADERWLGAIGPVATGTRFTAGERVLAFGHAAGKTAQVLATPGLWRDGAARGFAGFADAETDAPFLDHPWDLLRLNHHELVVEGEMAVRTAHAAELAPRDNPALLPGAHLVSPGSIALHPTARVAPGAVLDASQGPIVVERDAWLEPHTYVAGPCWIGAGTHVLGGKLGGGVSLGPVCRVAGEIEESIFQGWANKRHHGFVGHSIVGAWVNLGALTTTSDLKNNYGPVRVSLHGHEVATGETKVGAFLGDHVKTAIGTLLTTGTVVGPASNLVGGGITGPRELPAFAWWDGRETVPYDVGKFLATARVVCGRRGRTFGEAQERLYRALARGDTPERAGRFP